MSKDTKKPRAARKHKLVPSQPDFITKFEMAQHLCCAVGTIDEWMENGTIPEPHSSPGKRHPVWLRKHYEVYRDTGRWPQQGQAPA
jgi:hypothetical protein